MDQCVDPDNFFSILYIALKLLGLTENLAYISIMPTLFIVVAGR